MASLNGSSMHVAPTKSVGFGPIAPGEVEVVPAAVALHPASETLTFPIGTTLAAAQRDLILATLAHFRGDKQKTANVLGICLKTLYNRLQLYQGRISARP